MILLCSTLSMRNPIHSSRERMMQGLISSRWIEWHVIYIPDWDSYIHTFEEPINSLICLLLIEKKHVNAKKKVVALCLPLVTQLCLQTVLTRSHHTALLSGSKNTLIYSSFRPISTHSSFKVYGLICCCYTILQANFFISVGFPRYSIWGYVWLRDGNRNTQRELQDVEKKKNLKLLFKELAWNESK